MFGGGIGSVAGGALGGVLGTIGGGSGFGAQILASAIGTQVEAFITATAELGQAFTRTGLDAAALAKAVGQTGGAMEGLIEETKEVAGAQAAAESAAILMSAAIGEEATKSMTALGEATNDLNEASALLITEFQVLASTLLGPVASAVAGLLERTNAINAAQRILKEGVQMHKELEAHRALAQLVG